MKSDPCTWIYTRDGRVISIISGHVDDFLFVGSDSCEKWAELKASIQNQFNWQEWEKDDFVQRGVKVSRQDGSFELSQRQYVEDIPEIPISRERRRKKHEGTTEGEKSQLRGLLGALSWHVGQVGFKYCAHVGLSLSEVPVSTVESLEQANKLLHQIRSESRTAIIIHGFNAEDSLTLVGWCDAGSQNRRDGSSTEGMLIGMTESAAQQGAVVRVSPMFWRSSKIDRMCRSPGAAEARAAVDTEDNLYLLRYSWAEFCGYEPDVWHPDEHVRMVPGILVTDSRNVFDRVDKPYLSPKGAQKKVDIELFALKESQRRTDLIVRWVNSDAQLANTLTKKGEEHQISKFLALGQRWRIVYDPSMFSAKERKKRGMDSLQNHGEEETQDQPRLGAQVKLNLEPQTNGIACDT